MKIYRVRRAAVQLGNTKHEFAPLSVEPLPGGNYVAAHNSVDIPFAIEEGSTIIIDIENAIGNTGNAIIPIATGDDLVSVKDLLDHGVLSVTIKPKKDEAVLIQVTSNDEGISLLIEAHEIPPVPFRFY